MLCGVRLPKVTHRKNAESQGRRAMKMSKGWIAECFGEPDLIRRVTLRNTFFMTVKNIIVHLV